MKESEDGALKDQYNYVAYFEGPPGYVGGLMPGSVGDLVTRYVRERSQRKEMAPATARSHREVLALFARSVGSDRPINRVTRRHVEKFLERAEVAPSTLRLRLSIVRTFCTWAVEAGHLRKDPSVGIRTLRQPRSVPRALRATQVTEVLAQTADTRARVMVLLMCQEALRAVEVARLQLGDIDPNEQTILVKGKSNNERVLPLSDETLAAIRNYLAEEPARAGPLIRSRSHPGQGIQARYVSRLVSRALHAAGIAESGHSLRHTAASDMVRRQGSNLRDVQVALGHASLATTQRYLSWAMGDLRKAMGGRRYGEGPNKAPALGLSTPLVLKAIAAKHTVAKFLILSHPLPWSPW